MPRSSACKRTWCWSTGAHGNARPDPKKAVTPAARCSTFPGKGAPSVGESGLSLCRAVPVGVLRPADGLDRPGCRNHCRAGGIGRRPAQPGLLEMPQVAATPRASMESQTGVSRLHRHETESAPCRQAATAQERARALVRAGPAGHRLVGGLHARCPSLWPTFPAIQCRRRLQPGSGPYRSRHVDHIPAADANFEQIRSENSEISLSECATSTVVWLTSVMKATFSQPEQLNTEFLGCCCTASIDTL